MHTQGKGGLRQTRRTFFKTVNARTISASLLVVFASVLSHTAAAGLFRPDVSYVASEGYIYGFPILLMDETRDAFIGPNRDCDNGDDVNTFHHVYDIPGPNFQAVVRPNVDTLYSSAMLNLSRSPILLDMPAVPDRYVLMALLDIWTNNFAGLGTQSHGDGEGHYFITGPNWEGGDDDVPEGYIQVPSPTDFVWVIGRTEIKEGEPLQVVNDIQDQYQLRPYLNIGLEPPQVNCTQRKQPEEVVKDLSAREFFTRLNRLLREAPRSSLDENLLKRLALINVGPDSTATVASLNYFAQRSLEDGAYNAQSALDLVIAGLGAQRKWGPDPKMIPLGDFGDKYFIRAVVAQLGFGANRGEFAVYQNLTRDENFRLLSGDSHYTLTFPPGTEPPVRAFWSITVYNKAGFLVKNDAAEALGVTGIQRYAVSSNTGLTYEPDGSLIIHMATEPPAGVPLSNWLPVPDTNFEVTLRMYDPMDPILESEWSAPMIVREGSAY
ncbi:MAG TPA: hypothetical protein DEA26_04525 [Oceanospirillales bacterium]|nr:hypothetical protein [Oceanospirillaceae bacterium]HBS41923.1 hypothetical protein [Oceanospirillales bacterium]|tara:strand:- start:113722 stop:115203 length:1482 start_codon:yes stop_codon:yes gene_type:complete